MGRSEGVELTIFKRMIWVGFLKKGYCSIIYNSQDKEATQVSTDRSVDKEDTVYIHKGILLSHKKEWNLAIHNNIDGSRGYNAKWNESVRERQISYDFMPMMTLRDKTV